MRHQTRVFTGPDGNGPLLGYLRSGASLERVGEVVDGPRCKGGFHPIAPQGFVCASDVSTDPDHVLGKALARRPDRTAPLPFYYARSGRTPPPLYNRVPSREEQRLTEPELGGRAHLAQSAWAEFEFGEVPEFLEHGQSTLRFNGKRRSRLAVASGRPIADSSFAFHGLFESAGRYFGLSTELSVLPLDHLKPVIASQFAGVPLGRELTLPLVFVRARHAGLYSGHPRTGLTFERRIDYREAFKLTGETSRTAGKTFLEVLGGGWLEDTPELVHVDAVRSQPHWATPGRTWIDVAIGAQTLVAYEGMRPVYATLVSTGADGLKDPETSRSTIRGQYLIHTKHVTATMGSDEPGDEFELYDVPYVQYFEGGYALHAAFWHDAFGAPRSHGCVNLSPLDARWLFDWTEPRVPQLWHSAMSRLGGTLVSLHP
jgi:hypothetical protein